MAPDPSTSPPASAQGHTDADDTPTSRPLHVLLDTNVVLDLFLERDPWFSQAQPMWEARDQGRLVAYLTASTLTDIYYICRKAVGIERAKAITQLCLTGFVIAPVDHQTLVQAVALPGGDFEDNVQIACARSAELDCIVTRNIADFQHAPLLVIAPPDIPTHLSP